MVEPPDGSVGLKFQLPTKAGVHGSRISDAGLLAYRELDGLGLRSDGAGRAYSHISVRRGDVRWLAAAAVGVGRLAGYEDVNDAECPPYGPAMRWALGKRRNAARPEFGRHSRRRNRLRIGGQWFRYRLDAIFNERMVDRG